MNQFHYSMVIQWDSRDNIFVVRVPELPGCVTHGDTYEEAVRQGKDAIESWIMAAIADNEPIATTKRLCSSIKEKKHLRLVLPNVKTWVFLLTALTVNSVYFCLD